MRFYNPSIVLSWFDECVNLVNLSGFMLHTEINPALNQCISYVVYLGMCKRACGCIKNWAEGKLYHNYYLTLQNMFHLKKQTATLKQMETIK